MNPKISKLKAERAKNDGKIAMLQSRNREIDEDIIKLENEDIVGLFQTQVIYSENEKSRPSRLRKND